MIAYLSFADGPGMNVLKPHQQGTVTTVLENEVSRHEINRQAGIARKTLRKLEMAMAAARAEDSLAAGGAVQIPPPWPPAPGDRSPPAVAGARALGRRGASGRGLG